MNAIRALAFGLLLVLGANHSALALGIFNPTPGPWSLAREKACAAGSIPDCYLWLLDPPSFSEIFVEIEFDPAKMTIIDTGFLCDFAKAGTASCPTTPPGTTGDGSATVLGDPLDGSVVELVLGTGLLSLRYTLPVDAVFEGPDRNFFGIQFTSPYPNVAFFDTPGDYDFMQVSTSCRTTDDAVSCGSSNPIYGANFIPEPASIMLVGFGAVLLPLMRSFRRRRLDQVRA